MLYGSLRLSQTGFEKKAAPAQVLIEDRPIDFSFKNMSVSISETLLRQGQEIQVLYGE